MKFHFYETIYIHYCTLSVQSTINYVSDIERENCIRLKCSVKVSTCEFTIFETKRDERKFSKNIQ